MKEVSLSGSARTNVGKKDAKSVRNAGRVPCVIYGGGKQVHFSAKHTDLYKIMFSADVYAINIDVEGTVYKAIIQDYQQHPVTDKIVHIDFLELSDDKLVKVNIPVTLSGRSPGVMNGGRLQQVFRSLKVVGYPKDLPATIDVDISALKIGTSVRVNALENDSIKILNASNAVVVSVKMSRGATAEEEEEEAAAAAAAAASEGDAAEGEAAAE